MAGKNKGGREARKPKAAAKNKKPIGHALPPSTAVVDTVSGRPKK